MQHMLVPVQFDPKPLPPQPGTWRWLLPLLWSAGSGIVLWSWIRSARSPITGPAVHGLFRQRLILPETVTQRLTHDELTAVVAHERCHMRCRDNLTAAIHMLVEAVFWFHPLVWWIERRLVDERERACDEEALHAGSAPDVYASGILKICEFGIESRLACSAGVTGADLKARVEAIVNWRGVERLRGWHRAVLAAAAAIVVAVPILIGADRPTFDVASVKRYIEGPQGEAERKITVSPDGVTARRQTPRDLIQWAYGATEKSGPDMMDREEFNIEAKAGARVPIDQLRQMMQTMLADRFKLRFHRETRTLKVDTLVVGPHGLKLKELQQPPRRGFRISIIDGVAAFEMQCNMERFAEAVSMFTERAVIDKTGLTGTYQLTLRVPMDADQLKLMTTAQPFGGFGPTAAIYAAVEQFGLKLESKKAPVEVFVVDHIERPSEN
jgi:uncharacterized protein (TIGR03435 family)